jgi:hypothetical protein
LRYLEPNAIKNLFDKKRILLHLRIQSLDLLTDEELCKVFSDFMKRLHGANRVSEDIKYVRILKNNYSRHPYLDVLVFLEPNDKFNGIDHLLQIIEEHWAKAKACYFKNNFPVVRKIKEVVLLPLMSRVPECNREFLFIEETDGTKKKMVLNQILPAFIGQAVFLQTDQVFTKTRQLVAVGFSNNSIPKLAKSSR